MQDSYENGWDGATLLIEQDGVFIDEVTLENGSSGSVDVCIPSVDKNISLTYSSGSWDGENTYTLIDPDGNEIFSDGPFPSTSPISIDVDFLSMSIQNALPDELMILVKTAMMEIQTERERIKMVTEVLFAMVIVMILTQA